jgi:ABC-2 type transport system permease protein
MKISRLAALVRKESYQVVRDPSSILIAFVLPVLLLFIFGYGITLDSTKIKIGLVIEESGADVQGLVQAFTASDYFDVKTSRHRKEFEDELAAGRIRGMVVIPQGFSARAALNDESARIQVVADGSEPNIASFVHNYSMALWQGWLNRYAAENGMNNLKPPVTLEPRYWFNEELKSRNFLLSGSIAIIMTLIGTLLTSLVVSREWERGTMEALMSKPVTVAEIIIGKLIPYFILGMGSMVVCVVVAVFFYNVPLRGSLLMLTVMSSIFLIASLGQGLLISTLAKNQFVAAQIALLSAFLPAFILSGYIFEINSMPAPIRFVTHLFAARYFVTALQTLFLAGNIWPLILKNTAAICIIVFVFFFITSKMTKKTLD